MKKIISKTLAAVLCVLLMVCTLPQICFAFTYPPLNAEIPVACAVGTYELVDVETETVLDTLTFRGDAKISITYYEPGDYVYLLRSVNQDTNTADYELLVHVVNGEGDTLEVGGQSITRLDTETKVDLIRNYKIILKKVRDASNKVVLSGAKFDLYMGKDVTKAGKLASGAKPILSVQTNSKGTADLGNLQPGVYYLKETKAPAGYVLNSEFLKLEIRQISADEKNDQVIQFKGKNVELEKDGRTATIMQPNTLMPSNLPQTGQLWWPVAVLGILGLGMLTASIWLRRKEEQY